MTLKLISVGWDHGNGLSKLSLNGMVTKIPNGYSNKMPQGEVSNKTLLAGKPIAFGLEIDGNNLYFGQDILSGDVFKLIDRRKYKPEYLMTIFKAALYAWLQQPKTDSSILENHRLKITAGIPPEMYQDKSYRIMAEKAYKAIFGHNKPNYIKPKGLPAIPFFTSFGETEKSGLKPETLSVLALRKLQSGYTLFIDMGYGTFDYAYWHNGQDQPKGVKSIKNGLLHAYGEMNMINPHHAELEVMRKDSRPDMYLNRVELKIMEVLRALQNFKEPISLCIFGGGVKLLSKGTIKDFSNEVSNLWIGDEYTTARAFERIGKGE